MIALIIFITICLLTVLGIELFRRWSLKRELLYIPNERSSHKNPTPSGGGLVIAIVCILSYVAISYFYPDSFSWGYVAGALIVGVISWLDDLYPIWFVWRLIAQFIAAGLLMIDVGYWQTVALPFASVSIEFGQLGAVITFLWIVWLINAYNFMDGIDGLAGLHSVIAGISWMALGYMLEMHGLFYFTGVITSACVGFLVLNWHPARIFMGDVGSTFLGFTFATIPLLGGAEKQQPNSIFLTAAVMFVWFFLFDPFVTMIRRWVKGKPPWNPHRGHIYQLLMVSGISHGKVAVTYGILAALLNISALLSIKYRNEIGLAPICLLVALTVGLVIITVRRQKIKEV